MEGYLRSCDGTKLHYECWLPEQPAGTLVICHGHSEYAGRYAAFASRLVEEKLAVYAVDYRGHGKSNGLRGHVNSFDEYVSDLDALVQTAINPNAETKLILLGHSMGGLIACSYFLRYPVKIKALILVSPALRLKIKTAPIERLYCSILSFLKPGFALPRTLDPYDLAEDKKVVKSYLNDPLIHRKISARLYTEMIREGKEVLRRAKEFALPTLLLAGSNDRIIDVEAAKEFHKNLPAKIKSLKIYDGCYHELLNDTDKENVINDILGWIKSHSILLDTPTTAR